MTCLFNEPWLGICGKPVSANHVTCEKHAEEKCQVCGEQAMTRCQASRGLMCGIPLCQRCGAGEMCLYHAGHGPLMVIKALLGGGPESTIFATKEILIAKANVMKEIVIRLSKMKMSPTMKEFDEWKDSLKT